MTRKEEIEILMLDCLTLTKSEAERDLERGSTVFGDFEEHFESYMKDLGIDDEEEIMEYRQMVQTKIPVEDWGVVEKNGKFYYIMYVL